MEVQGRALLQPRILTRARALAPPTLALVAVLGVAIAFLAAQPVRSPWWTYADADATYAASGLNLLLGVPVRYLDHPGLPLEELTAAAFGVDMVVRAETGSRTTYVDRTLLDLDRARPVFRGLGIAFYLAGALLSFLLMARLFGHWLWGLAGGLLWPAAPGLVAMSIQLRPDVALTVLCLAVAYLIGRGMDERSAGRYAVAAALAGLATMLKLHAAGLIVPLVLAAVLRPPAPGWPARLRQGLSRNLRRLPILLAVVVVAALALAVNLDHLPFSPSATQLAAFFAPWALVGAFLGLTPAVRFLNPLYGLLGAAFLAGLALPVLLDLEDGLRAQVSLAKGLVGAGINSGVEPFGEGVDRFLHLLPAPVLLLFALAGVAAVAGAVQRDPKPIVWFAGAVVLGAMAEARTPAEHYFAPAFALAVPAVLWLFGRPRRPLGAAVLAALVAFALVPELRDREGPAHDAEAFAKREAPALELIRARLRPGEVGLTGSYWPDADTRYFQQVQQYVTHTPAYPYGLLPASRAAAALAAERGLRPRYYTGPETKGAISSTLAPGELGPFRVRSLGRNVVELLGSR